MQSRSWGYCTMLSPRMQPSAWVLKSRLGQLAGARAHQEASARARGLHPGQFAARGRAGQFAPMAARCRSCSSNRQRTSAGVAPRAIRALGSSLALVLIKRPAHVRGGGCLFANTPRAGCERNASIKKELESCPPPYLTSEGQIKEKARKYAASAYLPPGSSKRRKGPQTSAYSTLGANKRNPA